MALEIFDSSIFLAYFDDLSEEQKERVRFRVVERMSNEGKTSDDIIEMFDMLDIWPKGHARERHG